MAKADAARIEALARELAESWPYLLSRSDISERLDLASLLYCHKSDLPAIIEKARSLLPKLA